MKTAVNISKLAKLCIDTALYEESGGRLVIADPDGHLLIETCRPSLLEELNAKLKRPAEKRDGLLALADRYLNSNTQPATDSHILIEHQSDTYPKGCATLRAFLFPDYDGVYVRQDLLDIFSYDPDYVQLTGRLYPVILTLDHGWGYVLICPCRVNSESIRKNLKQLSEM